MLLISQETPRRQKPTHFLKEAVVLSGQNMRWWACFVCMLFMHALCIPRFLERTSISEGTCWYIDSMPTTSCNSKTESEKAPCATANALCYARPDKNTGPEHQNSRLGDWPLSAPAPATEGNLVAFPPILAGPLSHIKHRLGAKLTQDEKPSRTPSLCSPETLLWLLQPARPPQPHDPCCQFPGNLPPRFPENFGPGF